MTRGGLTVYLAGRRWGRRLLGLTYWPAIIRGVLADAKVALDPGEHR